MAWSNWTLWDAGLGLSAFLMGTMLVYRAQRRSGVPMAGRPVSRASTPGAARPAVQIPVRSIEQLVDVTHTSRLLKSIEQRMRYSAAQFERDCQPVLEAFAEFVQMLPASECHHHAQPGGLWIHALEVVDAALTFRAGIELPAGASTEDRKRQEHRWSYAVFAAALLHDVGKPVTDLQVMLYSQDPHIGRPWIPLAGAMRVNGAQFYAVSFTTPTDRDYHAHQKLAAMLLHQFVSPRIMRWLAEEGAALTQLMAYLAGEAPQEALAEIVKRADSDSVRRNLLHGPRTRFSSARTRPLIERLMEALRRMLQEGAALPMNRPGAAGWVHDGCIWFVCARLAEEVRNYLAQHESSQGVPGKERNDRMFDTWQESGAARVSPDGGAIWRVRVECESWRSPDVLTVLCFPLDKVYSEPGQYPATMKGRVIVEAAAASAAAPIAPAEPAAPVPPPTMMAASAPTKPAPTPGASPSSQVAAPSARTPGKVAPQKIQAPMSAAAAVLVPNPAPVPTTLAAPAPLSAEVLPGDAAKSRALPPPVSAPVPAPHTSEVPAPAASASAPTKSPSAAAPTGTGTVGAVATAPGPIGSGPASAAGTEPAVIAPTSTASPITPEARLPSETIAVPVDRHDEVLSADESARLVEPATELHKLPAAAAASFKVGAPMRPHQKSQPRPKKGPTPAAEALMAWVAHAVGSGELKYNEDKALVHFVPEGCLILSPEIFRRFVDLHQAIPESPVAQLVAEHGGTAFKRLQNELAQSGWTARAGDENLHPYAFVKADGSLSRPASFFLLPQPELFWNPVPQPNQRIRAVPRTKKLAVPASQAQAAR